jgi:hypothetical protein
MDDPTRADPVLIDATLVRNFLKRGFHRRLQDYFGGRAKMVLGVEAELERHADQSQPLRELLPEWPEGEALELPPELQEDARDLVEFHRDDGHAQENLGEIETYLMARHLNDGGADVLVVSDDTLAKKLCRQHDIDYIDTPRLVIRMVCDDFLTKQQGSLIWRECFTNQARWADYDVVLKQACGK